jgi:molecular chaperone GrpE (heat shock protein)
MPLLFCPMNFENRRSVLPFWPFVILDVLFLGMAVVIYKNAHRPFESIDAGLVIACVVGAAFCIALPFLRRNADDNAIAQAQLVADAVTEIKKLEAIAQQINGATAQWQGVQEHAAKTVETAREVADSMSVEAKAFVEFLKKANESEKSHLRLEVEKLRRAEGQWLEVLVRVMDNIHALHLAALQSGKANLINQMTQFQNSCFDATRRLGLIPVVVEPGAPYDDKSHQLFEGEKATAGAKVGATIGCGYTFQGQVLRKPVVMLHLEKVKEEKGVAQDVLPGIAS